MHHAFILLTESQGIIAIVCLCFALKDARVKMDHSKVVTLVNVRTLYLTENDVIHLYVYRLVLMLSRWLLTYHHHSHAW